MAYEQGKKEIIVPKKDKKRNIDELILKELKFLNAQLRGVK